MKKILTPTGEYILDDKLIFGVYTNSKNEILIDKISYRMLSPITNQRVFSDEELANPPYNYTKVEIDDKYSDCIGRDFNEDLTFSIEKYNARKQKQDNDEYENKIVALIRKKYNVNQELAILRQRDAKPQEFAEYNEYVEQCKEQVKNELWTYGIRIFA